MRIMMNSSVISCSKCTTSKILLAVDIPILSPLATRPLRSLLGESDFPIPIPSVGPKGRIEGLAFRRNNQRRSRQRFRNIAVSGDRAETRRLQPLGILRQRPTFALRRVRQRVDGKTQSECRLGALFVGHEVVDDELAAGLECAVSLGEKSLVPRWRLEAAKVAGENQVVVI